MSEEFIKPTVVDEEIILDPNKVIMSKTDKFGTFEFANDYFIEVSGYEEYELMGKSMFCIQHPDMPEVIFKHLWEKLLIKEETSIVVKNLTKAGKYYWSLTSFTFKLDENNDEIVAIYSKRIAANKKSIDFFSKLYKTLKNIELKNGIIASERYAEGFLEEKQADFNGLVKSFYSKTEDNGNTENKTNQQKKNSLQPIEKEHKLNVNKNDVFNDSSNLKQSKTKKSLFQKLFGKTDEELAEENKRKQKK